MTTTSSSSKASKRRTRREKQKLSVGITGTTTDAAAVDACTSAPCGRQRSPTKIIPGEAIIALSNAETGSEVQHRTIRTAARSTCPPETIQIGSTDAEHYIHYEKQKLPPEEEKKRKAAKRRIQYDAFLCRRGSSVRRLLPRHPQTGDPICERITGKLISKTARCPNDKIMHRIDVVDRDEGNAHIASVCWVHGSELDETVRQRLGLGCNEWKDGNAMKIFALKIVCYSSKTLEKLMELTAEDTGEVFIRYLFAHSEFLVKLLRRRWYHLALCHAVPLIRRIVASAHSNKATHRNIYRKILYKIWRDILPVFQSFRWAHSMLGFNLICYYRKDSGIVIMRHKK